MKLLGIGDIAVRWNYSKQGVHKIMKNELGNLKPVAKINRAKTSVFLESDIAEYEKGKIWLSSKRAKLRRQSLYGKLNNLKGLNPFEQKVALENIFGKDKVQAKY